MFLRVHIEPDMRIKLDYQVFCKNSHRQDGVDRSRMTRSRRIALPLLVSDPSSCLVYAFGTYKNFRYHRPVRFRITLFAKSRSAS